jgi:hypothetical protein
MATTFLVPDGRVAMAATTYAGSGAAQTVSNAVNSVGMQPDLVWIKNRSGANSNQLVDSIRGVTKYLFSDATAADDTRTDQVTAFSAYGFSLSALVSNTAVNNTGNNYVAWQWKAGGTAASNTAGTITSSVSANTTAGFSIVTYTGNGTNGATVGHGLGAKPSFIIEKGRGSAYNWSVQGGGVMWTPATSALWLNSTAGLNAAQIPAVATTSVFTPSVTGYSNESGITYVAYCWAPVAGYSAFGSYTGNGSADGPFVYTGFRPRFLMIKSSGSAQGWVLQDSSRQPYNYTLRNALFANDAMAELNDAYPTDFLSNGFKIRNSGDGVNTSAITYIYAAFAENPLKYSNAR